MATTHQNRAVLAFTFYFVVFVGHIHLEKLDILVITRNRHQIGFRIFQKAKIAKFVICYYKN
jgi:hypothetical protein